jgi:hypothetical protein
LADVCHDGWDFGNGDAFFGIAFGVEGCASEEGDFSFGIEVEVFARKPIANVAGD